MGLNEELEEIKTDYSPAPGAPGWDFPMVARRGVSDALWPEAATGRTTRGRSDETACILPKIPETDH